MFSTEFVSRSFKPLMASVALAAGAAAGAVAYGGDGNALPVSSRSLAGHTTTVFHGAKVNAGTVTHRKDGARNVLTWSDDFKIPDTPAPHWQVVDSKGNVYLLQRLKIKDDKVNRTITVPAYVPDIAKVQIWCAWAEVLLGEAEFDAPMK